MSYHFHIKSNKKITYRQLLENHYLPEGTQFTYEAELDDPIIEYNKFYITKLSSRGVVLSIDTNNDFDVEVNVGATKDDWALAIKITLALAEINDSTVYPEFNGEMSLTQFELEFGDDWIEQNKHLGLSSLLFTIKEYNSSFALNGCLRKYCIGEYVINELSKRTNNESELFDQLIEEVRKIQFLKHYDNEIEFLLYNKMDTPDGEKIISMLPPGYKVLIPPLDYIMLNYPNVGNKTIPFNEFISFVENHANRVDESQYILEAIDEKLYIEILNHFINLHKNQNKPVNQSVKIEPKNNKDTETVNKEFDKLLNQDTKNKKWWNFWK
jgi:hypothetical protein